MALPQDATPQPCFGKKKFNSETAVRNDEQRVITPFPVEYMLVTGRISRAKKDVLVHTCEICRPVKVR